MSIATIGELIDWFAVYFHTCTAVAHFLCISWAFLF